MEALHWNSAQSRVQSMKEDLKNHDPNHLRSFLEGISDPEPPHYRKMNGKTEPPLEKVTLKPDANNFHVGNVIMAEGSAVRYIYFTVNKDEVEACETDALPKDQANPLSVTIPQVILLDLYPLWDAKFKAIKQCLLQVNDVRSYAYNAPNQPGRNFSYGKNLLKLMSGQVARDGGLITGNGVNTRKRASGEPIPRHPSNKRARIGLESIPSSVKMDAFKAIPDQFAVSLFNTIAKAAFPGFDNLVMAAWNVVCVYEFVGTEFPGFHNAIVELKSVLQEFDATYRKERSVTRNEQKNRQGHKGTKTESPAETANSVPTRYGQQITNIHDRLQEQHGPTMESDTMKFSTTSTPMQAPDRPDAMTMDGNRSPKPVRDYQSIPAVRPPGEKKSSENFDPPKEPKASQNAQKQHTQPTGRTREMTAEEMKKQDLVTQLKDRQRQLHELKTGHKQTTALEQWSDNHHSNKNNNDCNERPIERSHYEGNNSKPTPIGPKPTKKVRPFQEVDSKDEEVKIPHGSEAGVQSQQPTISLGQSKLGRPKAGALGNGSAPEAPMIHNGKREQNGNGRSS